MDGRPEASASGLWKEHREGLLAAVADAGYAAGTVARCERVLRALDDWLVSEGLSAGQATGEAVDRFAARLRSAGGRGGGVPGLALMLAYLRDVGAVPPAPEPVRGPIETVLADFARYLSSQRRLAPLTVTTTVGVVRRFLRDRADSRGGLDLPGLTVEVAHGWVRSEADRLSVGATRAVIVSFRSFLSYLYVTGVLDRDLGATLPGVSGRRFESTSRAVDETTVRALLATCDRGTSVGRRDHAILTLLLRLGLRASEVARMTLDDIDWRAGSLVVHGKGGRDALLPLPADVGEAIVDYLQHGRARTSSRAVFLRATPPLGPISRNAVVWVPRTASLRAGVPMVGSHRLRHTAATRMLHSGATLREVGEVLRHTDDATTAIYAKADRRSLDLVVRPWPGARP